MALSAETVREYGTRSQEFHVVKNGITLYSGALVGLDRSVGRVTTWADDLNYLFLGIAKPETTSKLGVSGATVFCPVDTSGSIIRKVAVTGVTALTDLGKRVYASDDNTLTLTASTKALHVGVIIRWYSSTTCDVRLLTPAEYELIRQQTIIEQQLATVADLSAGVPFILRAQTASGATTKQIYNAAAPFAMKIMAVIGVMTGAGAGSDTVKLTDGTNDITNTEDVSAKGDKDMFLFGEIDNAYSSLAAGATLNVVTASDALVEVLIIAVPV